MRACAAVLALLLAVPAPAAGVELPCLVRPHPGPVVAPFEQPPCPFCAGHRGVTLRTGPDDPVRAMAPGRVSFAGSVAGTLYVTVDHGRGLRTTVGLLLAVTVRQGQAVDAGQELGRSGAELLVTVRRDDEYVDPEPLLGRPTWHARLVPSDGTAPRPARPAGLRCPAHARSAPRSATGTAAPVGNGGSVG